MLNLKIGSLCQPTIAKNIHQQSGYSLIELIITVVLTSIVIIVFYQVFAFNQRQSTSPVLQVKAAELAQAYLEEISLRKYDENSPAGNGQRCNSPSAPACSATLGSNGETRQFYDDVDDYNGLTESPPRDAFDNIRTGFNNFTTTITVTYAGTDFGLNAQDAKRIQVTIDSPEGDQFTFSQYRGNF